MNVNKNNLVKEVERIISETGSRLVADQARSNRTWTSSIKQALHIFANDLNIDVYTHPNDYDKTVNEWLYDQVWYTVKDNKELERVYMVLESEWLESWDEIIYDFNKLIMARADLRVFIFQSNNPENVTNLISRLQNIVLTNKITQSGDEFLICGYNYFTGEFDIKAVVKS